MLKELLFGWAEKQALPNISFLDFKFTDVVTISGKRNSGKTYFANKLIEECTRYVIWDYRFERVNKITPFTPFTSKKAVLITDKTIKITTDVNDIGKFNRIIFHPYAKDKDEMEELFNSVAKAIYRSGNYIFVVEEADSIADRFHPLKSGLFELLQGNIHVNCGLIFITRRLQNLNTDLVRQSDKLILFRYSNKDKEYLEGYIGTDELKQEIANRQFYIYDGEDLKFFEDGLNE